MKNSSMINGSVDGGGGNDDNPRGSHGNGSSVCERRRERQNLLTQGMAVVGVYKGEMTVVGVYTIN
jgi:hypothetical protein